MKRFYLFIGILFVCCTMLSAQQAKKPWVTGHLPQSLKNSTYKVVFTVGQDLQKALENADEKFITSNLSLYGVDVSAESVREIIKKQNFSKGQEDKMQETSSRKKTMRFQYKGKTIAFAKVDHYYEYKNGAYHLWVLYLVADEGKKLGQVPTLAYKIDNGAWRSVLVPGWAQFYTKQALKGSLFLGSEVALLSSGLYFYNRYNYNNNRVLEANTVKLKQEFRKRAKDNKNYSYIALGAAAGVYIYNLVDAFTCKKGKVTYDYKKMHLHPTVNLVSSPFSTEEYYVLGGVSITF